MSAKIAALGVELDARSGNFDKKFRRSGGQVDRFGKKVQRSSFRMKGARVSAMALASGVGALGKRALASGALFAGAAVVGVAVFTKRAMTAIDVTSKLSDTLNISTGSLSALQLAAQIYGSDQAQVNKGLQGFVRRLGEAKVGMGQAKPMLEKLGLSADKLANVPVDEALKIVADRINMLPNAASQAGAAYALFGRQGLSLANLIKGGSKAMEEQEREARRLGITFGRVDGAKVEAANDSITRMGALWKGIFNQVAIKVSPAIQSAADKAIAFATSGDGIKSNVGGALESIGRRVLWVVDLWSKLKAMPAGFVAAVAQAAASVVKRIGTMAEGVQNLLNKIPGVNIDIDTTRNKRLAKGLQAIATAAGKQFEEQIAKKPSDALAKFWNDAQAKGQAAAENVAAAVKTPPLTTEDFDQVDKGTQKVFDRMRGRAAAVFDKTRTPLEKYKGQVAELNDLKDGGFISAETKARGLMDAEKKLHDEIKKRKDEEKEEAGGAKVGNFGRMVTGFGKGKRDKKERQAEAAATRETQSQIAGASRASRPSVGAAGLGGGRVDQDILAELRALNQKTDIANGVRLG